MINVTKTFLPPFEEYNATLMRAWEKGWITNNGELVRELETKISSYLQTDHFLFCSNGTIVLQMALKALDISGEVITTPFSYVATVNALLWEGCTPVFADIDPETLTIDPASVESLIKPETQAILATHVFGYPCDIDVLQSIADKHGLKLIYDGAHAFGCRYRGQSVLSFGDISTCSFHATKIFHTVEGGGLVCNNRELAHQLYLLRSFGHIADDYYCTGINGKNSELHAAMGLTNLPYLEGIISHRKSVSEQYDQLLSDHVTLLKKPDTLEYNYAYYPVLFASEQQLLTVKMHLENKEIFPRRYFYPSLNNLPQTKHLNAVCPVSDSVSRRVLCLPLFDGLSETETTLIADTVVAALKGTGVAV